MGWCKEDVTPLLTHWSCVFLALTHRYGITRPQGVNFILSILANWTVVLIMVMMMIMVKPIICLIVAKIWYRQSWVRFIIMMIVCPSVVKYKDSFYQTAGQWSDCVHDIQWAIILWWPFLELLYQRPVIFFIIKTPMNIRCRKMKSTCPSFSSEWKGLKQNERVSF